MGGILGRRSLRELRAHFMRYLALFLMIVLAMYLIVSLIGAADTTIIGTQRHAEQNYIEDGQFTTFVPLSAAQLDELTETGVDIVPMFYREYVMADESVLRVFKIRERIDILELVSGEQVTTDTIPADDLKRVYLDRRYSDVKFIAEGDTLHVADMDLTVAGLVSAPDYEAPLRGMGDSTVDSANFGTLFVSPALYDALAATGLSYKSEEYLYAYRLNGAMTDNELRDKIKDYRFDPKDVEDVDFHNYWDQLYADRDELLDGVQELTDGTQELYDGSVELRDGAKELSDGAKELSDGAGELSDGAKELADGTIQLRDALRGQNLSFDAGALGQIPQINLSPAQLQALQASLPPEVFSQLAGVAAGMEALQGGAQQLQDGLAQLDQGIGELRSGVNELADGAGELSDGAAELYDGSVELYDGTVELYDGTEELVNGTQELVDGTQELSDGINELLDEVWPVADENLRSFVIRDDNPRVGAAADDCQIDKMGAIVAGFIIMALLAYVISVFVVHSIEAEQTIIGTLYALGVRRRELLTHYLVLPVLVSLAGGLVGTALGYSAKGVGVQLADSYAYFSMPTLQTLVEPWVLIYGIVMPPAAAALVNLIVIRRKLSAPALRMIRGETQQQRGGASDIDLKNMSYIGRFRLRQMLREGRSALGVVLALFICLLLLMLGVNAYMLCTHVGADNIRDTRYEYMYVYKYPDKDVPEGGYAAYAETVKKEVMGYNMDVTILGLDGENPFFDAQPARSQGKVYISTAMAQKYGLSVGESFTVQDPQNDRGYGFTVDGIAEYAPAFYVFMDIESMRELFGMPDDYYNVVFADHDLGIDPGRLYSVSSKADVEKAAGVFVELMWGMVYTMVGASIIIMAVVMYLMMKVMIDRSSRAIALFKVMGYRRRELSKLFLSGNTILIAVGTAIAVPLSKYLMDAMYPYLVSNVACAMNLEFPLWLYGAIYVGVMLVYFVIHAFLVHRIGKIDLGVILKGRE